MKSDEALGIGFCCFIGANSDIRRGRAVTISPISSSSSTTILQQHILYNIGIATIEASSLLKNTDLRSILHTVEKNFHKKRSRNSAVDSLTTEIYKEFQAVQYFRYIFHFLSIVFSNCLITFNTKYQLRVEMLKCGNFYDKSICSPHKNEHNNAHIFENEKNLHMEIREEFKRIEIILTGCHL